jgi:TetR/AcrR family transcriptional regulator, transcriptional repressor for nem operon
VPKTPTPQTQSIRQRLLVTAFSEVYRRSFQSASLSDIVAAARTTKGALFHHFDGKHALGYAIVDELLSPILSDRWLAPLADTNDPTTALQKSFRRHIADDTSSGNWVYGCPMNNLAQEMSPLDQGFRTRFDALYDRWRQTVSSALVRGQRARTVRSDVDATGAATLVVVGQIGIWATGKHSRNAQLMIDAGEALCAGLETLRAGRSKKTPRTARNSR